MRTARGLAGQGRAGHAGEGAGPCLECLYTLKHRRLRSPGAPEQLRASLTALLKDPLVMASPG